MTKLIRIFYLVFILTPFSLIAQKEIIVSFDQSKGIYLTHEVSQGETFFGISKKYGHKVDDLMKYNAALAHNGLSPGDQLHIPFLKKKVSVIGNPSSLQLIYVVKPGTTLFSIRTASGLTVDELKRINNLKSSYLSPGQRITIGFYNSGETNIPVIQSGETNKLESSTITLDVEKTPPNANSPGTIVHEEVSDLPLSQTAKVIEMKYEEERGVAVWNQEWKSTSGFYVLHRNAPINSIIEIENPMFGRKAYGKVSGRIPTTLYSSDIILIVSDALARHLGVIDQRFFVKLRYLQPE